MLGVSLLIFRQYLKISSLGATISLRELTEIIKYEVENFGKRENK